MKELDKRNVSHEEIFKIKADLEKENESNGTKKSSFFQSQSDSGSSKSEEKLRIEKEIKNGANWFYWIAGLSLINTIALMANSSWNFPVGLGITQLVDAFTITLKQTFGNIIVMAGSAINIIFAGLFVMFGYFANRQSRRMFIAGMVLNGLDAIVFLFAKDWVGFGLHVFGSVMMYRGLSAIGKLENLKSEELEGI